MSCLVRALMACVASVVVCGAASAGIDRPPPFPVTSPGFTCQSWEFLTPSLPQPPDPGWINPFGLPEMRLKGNPIWQPGFEGKEGVWCLTRGTGTPEADSLNFLIPNANVLTDQKEIVVFVKWFGAASAGFGPGYQVLTPNMTAPMFGQPIAREPAGPNHPGWLIDTVIFTLPKCPPWEEIKIGAFDVPPGVNLYIDCVSIYTRCIPSPGGVSVIGLALVAAARRRR